MPRGRRKSTFLLFLVVAALLALSAPAAFAQDGDLGSGTPVAAGLATERSVANQYAGQIGVVGQNTLRYPDGRIGVLVELSAEAGALSFARAGGEIAGAAALQSADAQMSAITAQQNSFRATLASANLGATALNATQFLVNTVELAVPEANLAALAALPNVVSVTPVRRVDKDLATSVALIGAVDAWSGAAGTGVTGEGIVVAVIDDGIDFTHRMFGGNGQYPANAADRTLPPPVQYFGPGAKVIGGYDFVGDAYNFGLPQVPDPNPLGCQFGTGTHGTSVAGIVAGYGLNGDGTTYTGTYNNPPLATMAVGPGVAPEASLVALRIFGCAGSTSTALIIAAMESAIRGTHTGGVRADVINMSLGSNYGDAASIEAQAVDNASLAGTVVVAAAGNDNDIFYVHGSPASSTSAIAAAASNTGSVFLARILTPAVTDVQAGYGGRFSSLPITGEVAIATDTTAPVFNACEPLTAASATAVAGKIALVDRGTCTFEVKAGNVAAAGAIAMLIGNNAAGAPINPGGSATIPMVMVPNSIGFSGFAGGSYIRNQIAGGATVTMTLDLALTAIIPTTVDTIADYSSRGTINAGGAVKPDVAAPYSVTSVESGSGDGLNPFGGTSAASPHIAGVAALILSHPDYDNLSPAEVKALIVNTATNNMYNLNNVSGPRLSPQRTGTGRVDVINALTSGGIAYNNADARQVGINFGLVEDTTDGEETTRGGSIRVANLSGTAISYTLTYEAISNNPYATMETSTTTVTVAPYSSATFDVEAIVNFPITATQPNVPDPSIALGQTWPFTGGTAFPRHYVPEESGVVVLTPTSGDDVSLRVPVYMISRAAASTRYPFENYTLLDASGESSVFVGGDGLDTGTTYPRDVTGVVSAFALTHVDPVGDTPYPAAPGFDIQYAGITSNFNNGGSTAGNLNADSYIMFGIGAAGDWSSLNAGDFTIWMDTDDDDDADWATTISPITFLGTEPTSDVFLTELLDIENGQVYLQEFINGTGAGFPTYALNNNVLSMVVYPYVNATVQMLEPGDTDFYYYVETVEYYNYGDIMDTTDWAYVDLANMTIDTQDVTGLGVFDYPYWDDNGSNFVPFRYDVGGASLDFLGANNLLLLHHHGTAASPAGAEPVDSFRRAEVVDLDFPTADVGFGEFTVTPDDLVGGDTVTVTIEVVNYASVATDVEATFEIDPALSLTSVTTDIGTCTSSGSPFGGTVDCDFGSLGGYTAATVTAVFQIDPNFIGVAEIEGELSVGGLDATLFDNFTVVEIAVSPDQVVLIAPLGTLAAAPTEFSWTQEGNSGWYHMWISRSDGVYIADAWFPFTTCDSGVCTIDETDIDLDLPGGTYSWWIQAWQEDAGYGEWSEEGIFSVAVAPAAPVTVAPVGTIVSTDPSYLWNEAPGATWYYVLVTESGGVNNGATVDAQWFNAAASCTAGVCSGTLATLHSGAFNWNVLGWNNEGGFGPYSTTTAFAVNVPLGAPIVTTPTGDPQYTTNSFTIAWTNVPGAEEYTVTVSAVIDGSPAVVTDTVDATTVCGGGGCTKNYTAFGTGTYSVTVAAGNTVAGYGPISSPEATFSILLAPPAAFGVSPSGVIADNTLSFAWNAATGASWYYLYISPVGGGSPVFTQWYESAVVCTGSTSIDTCATPDIPVLADAAYTWLVRSWNTTDYGPWSAGIDFTINALPLIDPGVPAAPEVAPVEPSLPVEGEALPAEGS